MTQNDHLGGGKLLTYLIQEVPKRIEKLALDIVLEGDFIGTEHPKGFADMRHGEIQRRALHQYLGKRVKSGGREETTKIFPVLSSHIICVLSFELICTSLYADKSLASFISGHSPTLPVLNAFRKASHRLPIGGPGFNDDCDKR